jgi:predicted RNA-binding protein with PUA domain
MKFKVGDYVKPSKNYNKKCMENKCEWCPFPPFGYAIVDRISERAIRLKGKYGGHCTLVGENELELLNGIPKYNVGDEVTILDYDYGILLRDLKNMYSKLIGTTATIIGIKNNEYGIKYQIDKMDFWGIPHEIKEEHLMIVDKKISKPKIEQKHYTIENLHIIVNHRAVIVIDTNTKKKGVAKCHPDDEFDFKVGLALAMERLNKQEEY